MKLLLFTTILMLAFSNASADMKHKEKKHKIPKDAEYICLEIVNEK